MFKHKKKYNKTKKKIHKNLKMSICAESNCPKIGNHCNKCGKAFCGIHMPTDGGSVKGFHKSLEGVFWFLGR